MRCAQSPPGLGFPRRRVASRPIETHPARVVGHAQGRAQGFPRHVQRGRRRKVILRGVGQAHPPHHRRHQRARRSEVHAQTHPGRHPVGGPRVAIFIGQRNIHGARPRPKEAVGQAIPRPTVVVERHRRFANLRRLTQLLPHRVRKARRGKPQGRKLHLHRPVRHLEPHRPGGGHRLRIPLAQHIREPVSGEGIDQKLLAPHRDQHHLEHLPGPHVSRPRPADAPVVHRAAIPPHFGGAVAPEHQPRPGREVAGGAPPHAHGFVPLPAPVGKPRQPQAFVGAHRGQARSAPRGVGIHAPHPGAPAALVVAVFPPRPEVKVGSAPLRVRAGVVRVPRIPQGLGSQHQGVRDGVEPGAREGSPVQFPRQFQAVGGQAQ